MAFNKLVKFDNNFWILIARLFGINRDPYEMGDVQQFSIEVSHGWQSNRYESKNIKKRSPNWDRNGS